MYCLYKILLLLYQDRVRSFCWSLQTRTIILYSPLRTRRKMAAPSHDYRLNCGKKRRAAPPYGWKRNYGRRGRSWWPLTPSWRKSGPCEPTAGNRARQRIVTLCVLSASITAATWKRAIAVTTIAPASTAVLPHNSWISCWIDMTDLSRR